MLTFFGAGQRLCDGVNRRSFLRVGTLGVGATSLSLSDIFRAEARSAEEGGSTGSRHKAIINIFLGGGPPHQDMWDLKPDAPKEIRGEFNPIATAVPGLQIGECFPLIADRMKRFAVLRTIVGASGGHDAIQCMSGWRQDSLRSMGGRPSLGAAVARLQGPVDPSVPPFVGLAAKTAHLPWSDPGTTGFLGAPYAPFKPEGPGLADLKLSTMTFDALADRRRLLASFDGMRKEIDNGGILRGADAATERALGVLTSSRLLEALDLSQESEKVRARYGDGRPYNFQYDGAPTVNEHFLLARRLVEAGVRVVTLSYGRWDSHGQNFALVRDHGPKLDRGLSALVDDLEVRGMLDDVTVIAWGEFGRTPRINKDAGRDHWPQVSCAILAGGGMKTGQAIGATNRLGEYAKDRPIQFGEVHATLYRNLGIDPSATLLDPTGRPEHLVDDAPIPELV
jgi:Protein of unknown function (DUF1501)